MTKFVALLNRLFLSVPFVKKDESGKIVENRTLTFIRGTKVGENRTPAYYNTDNQDEIDYLRKYKGNSANGGSSFKEVEVVSKAPKASPAPAAPKAPEAPAPQATAANEPKAPVQTEDPTQTAGPEAPDPSNESADDKTYPDVTTVQAAFAILKTYDQDLKVAEHRSKAAVLQTAETLGVSFPNL